jgi:short-subunit dehydrogenase
MSECRTHFFKGITNPPGNPAYNISKTGVKFFTEGLAYDLRTNYPNSPISVHLLIPGWVYSVRFCTCPSNTKGMTRTRLSEKPPGAWTTEQCVDQLIKSLNAGDFYVLCEDNDVKRWQDEKRMQWNVDDVIKNRSALSRWDAKHKDDFEAFMKQ